MTHTGTRSILKVLVVVLAATSLFSFATGALGKKGPSGKGGKKPIGTVASFDASSGVLTVDLKDGSQFEGVATEDTRVKIDHRGKPGKKGNPTTGSLEDLVAGYKVLRLKSSTTDEGTTVEKIKVRKEAAPAACTDADGDGLDDSSGVACEGDDPGENGGDAGDGAGSP